MPPAVKNPLSCLAGLSPFHYDDAHGQRQESPSGNVARKQLYQGRRARDANQNGCASKALLT
jgi:hypothetical protein